MDAQYKFGTQEDNEILKKVLTEHSDSRWMVMNHSGGYLIYLSTKAFQKRKLKDRLTIDQVEKALTNLGFVSHEGEEHAFFRVRDWTPGQESDPKVKLSTSHFISRITRRA